MTNIQIDDLIFWEDVVNNKYHRLWVVKGVYIGCLGQESLVELQNLFEKPGVPGLTGEKMTTFVPEPLLRNAQVYRKVK